MRYVLNIKYTWIVCLESGRGIDRHAYRDTVAAVYSLQISRPRLGRNIDPVWITVAPKGSPHITGHRSLSRTVMIPSGIILQGIGHYLVQ